MSSSLGEKLVREFKRNKAKSAILGVLCLVACYFWLPLVTKPLKNKKDIAQPAAASQAVPTVQAAAAVGAEPAPPANDAPQFEWKDFLDWMSHDPRMSVTAIPATTRDPFALPGAAPLNEQSEAPNGAAAGQRTTANESNPLAADQADSPNSQIPVKSPAEYGMVLKSTIMGGNRSTANINGTIFRLGEIVPMASTETEATETALDPARGFRLLEIKARYVTLQWEDRLFRLELEPRGKGNIKIRSVSR